MDKPFNMSVKEYLIRIQSVRTNTPLKVIEAVINHQFEQAHQALENNHSLEISGFGKLLFNHKKARKVMEKELSKEALFLEKLEKETDEKKRKSLELKLSNTRETIKNLKPKINEFRTDNRGVEEPINTTEGDERDNREDIRTTNGNM